MKFRSKLFAIYAVFMLIVTVVIGEIYYSNQHTTLRKQEEQSLDFFAAQMSVRFDDEFKKMQYGISYLLSDMNLIDDLILLSSSGKRNNVPNSFKIDARNEISKTLKSYYLVNNFYRVILFNDYGDIIVSNDLEKATVDYSKQAKDLEWLDQLKQAKYKSIIVGIHPDDWGLKTNPEVISLVKEITGMNMGYIEMQILTTDLVKDLDWSNDNYEMILALSDGEILYSSKNSTNCDFYMDLLKSGKTNVGKYYNPDTKETELVAMATSELSGTTVFMIEKEEVLKAKEMYSVYYTLITCIIFAAISMLFLWISSSYLARPIKRMRTMMEQTELNNMNRNILIDNSSDEMEALYSSYQGLMDRLSEAMTKEKESSLLQMQAQFDTLQAQVNPHFIYNVLNVISNKGMMVDDESICKICSCLATMLRYSTNTKERYATIADEMLYLDQYCFLIKERFKHRFEYEYSVSEDIKNYLLPKLTLQQLVENSITHGFNNTMDTMRITITGWSEEAFVYIQVSDNGEGFREEEIAGLYEKFNQFKDRYRQSKKIMDLEIGGMGLVNTFARIYLIYNDNLTFRIENNNGAIVTIGLRINDRGGSTCTQ